LWQILLNWRVQHLGEHECAEQQLNVNPPRRSIPMLLQDHKPGNEQGDRKAVAPAMPGKAGAWGASLRHAGREHEPEPAKRDSDQAKREGAAKSNMTAERKSG